MSSAIANEIDIQVESKYIEGQSDPQNNRYVFAYTVKIHNTSQVATRLMARHWVITNANGDSIEVTGPGVVGDQPEILPGEHYQYTSGTILETPVGTMHGYYRMLSPCGNDSAAEIKPFRLAKPSLLH